MRRVSDGHGGFGSADLCGKAGGHGSLSLLRASSMPDGGGQQAETKVADLDYFLSVRCVHRIAIRSPTAEQKKEGL